MHWQKIIPQKNYYVKDQHAYMKIGKFRIDIPYKFSAQGRGSLPKNLPSYPLDNEITGV